MAADVEVTGAMEANLWICSDAVDTDFTIKLIDVYPPLELRVARNTVYMDSARASHVVLPVIT